MQPHFKPNDKIMFIKHLNKCSNFLEYGCGGSTFLAVSSSNINNVYSIESDKEWIQKVDKSLNLDAKTKLKFFYKEILTRPNNWGNPGRNCPLLNKKNYSDGINDMEIMKHIDLVLIDGRFRVACCLKLYDKISENCLIAFDDYMNRNFYHVVEKYFKIIDHTQDKCMVILQKIPNLTMDNNLIQTYEPNQS